MPAPSPEPRAPDSAAAREELAWFDRMCAGDEAALESLFRAYFNPLYDFAYSYVGSEASAQDIVQELFIRLWERRDMLERPRNVYAYLFGAVRNRAVSHLRSRRVEHAFAARVLREERLGAQIPAPQEQALDAAALAAALDRAVRELPPRCREVFALTRGQRLSHAQVAELLRIAPKTVHIHMGRALALLRQKLGPWLQG